MDKHSHSSSALPAVTVAIPAYKSGATLARALDSVCAQTYPGIVQILVVDDGSPDDDARRICAGYPSVQYFRQENQGVLGARNAGLSMAVGEWLALLDHDDAWKPDKIQRQVDALAAYPRAGLVLTQCELRTANGKVAQPQRVPHDGPVPLTLRDWTTRGRQRLGLRYVGSTWLVRKAALQALGGFCLDQTGLSEDWPTLFRLLQAGEQTVLVPLPLVERYLYADSMSGSRSRQQRRDQIWEQLGCLEAAVEAQRDRGEGLARTSVRASCSMRPASGVRIYCAGVSRPTRPGCSARP